MRIPFPRSGRQHSQLRYVRLLVQRTRELELLSIFTLFGAFQSLKRRYNNVAPGDTPNNSIA